MRKENEERKARLRLEEGEGKSGEWEQDVHGEMRVLA